MPSPRTSSRCDSCWIASFTSPARSRFIVFDRRERIDQPHLLDMCGVARPAVGGCANTTGQRLRTPRIATLRRLTLNKNSMLRRQLVGTGGRHRNQTYTGASCPWNLSTVPIRAPAGSMRVKRLTCAL